MSFCFKFILVHMCHFSIKRFDKVIAKIKGCNFLPQSVDKSYWLFTRKNQPTKCTYVVLALKASITPGTIYGVRTRSTQHCMSTRN